MGRMYSQSAKKSFGVIVHAGAGFHSESKAAEYESVCQTACQRAVACLKRGQSAVNAVEEALKSLEDSPITNAGLGSMLNADGDVECDACLHCSRTGYFGGVGSVSGVRNPSTVAAALLQQQIDNPTLELGRIPPSVLTGVGARKWAVEKGLTTVVPGDLITPESRRNFCKYTRRLHRYQQMVKEATGEGATGSKRRKVDHEVKDDAISDNSAMEDSLMSKLDTVGVVCVDSQGHVVSGASSGGIALKFPGRVGQACIPGAGCWALENNETKEAVGSATTGTGEHLMRTMLAMRTATSCLCDDESTIDALYRSIRDDFLSATSLSNIIEKNAGVIVLRTHAAVNGFNPKIEFIFAHSTRSMAVGYMSSKCRKPTVLISRASDDRDKDSVTIGGQVIKT